MDFKAGLWQQQTLKLMLTQELTQAIALLQYSAQELNAFLENKAAENPLLQLDSGNFQTAIDPRMDRSKSSWKNSQKDKKNWIEQIGEKVVSLDEYLRSQINFKQVTTRQIQILTDFILNLDENGYFYDWHEAVAKYPLQEAEECLHILQQLDPAGIGARSLQECLLLQLQRLGNRNALAEMIITDYFHPFANKNWKLISKEAGIELKEIQQTFDFIQTLNPRPGALFQQQKPVYMIPDVIIDWNGIDYTVTILDSVIPKLSFNHAYFTEMSTYKDDQVSRFLQEKKQDYYWILKSLEQRKETLLKVTMKIVEKQQGFFKKGREGLKPLIMKEISDELGIHESTVSRAVREKYAQTPFGTMELKSFFTSTIQTVSSENTSSAQVKSKIEAYVAAENKQKPLSDQEIVARLQEEGMIVSRRTVAKYRDQLGIASSSKRKRYE
ncbi:RNA polymerase sigma-54 factor [Bacillus canaveralius]|uniref:RNA polymerase sigma-54 factor n=1 Tax=Bacillus canaveralius TaxID=1403243 RepID=A0A2N5GQL4_9BACI|nr:RNA polymerase factor sigma-54 [Bacillus canaveralius]PLR85370.1 RNA polymerase sigma-54 factor [Bacillus canaveralius]PLR99310.1 RNA polymerase sigma-54 factor [Bacillus canaveralius]